ncbi:MAG TPA: hypothetical protein PLG97_13970, partial [Alcaligenes sp.]|nr:hypothetical protein [Alcaligenes sp.]HRL28624.1 hypothetical protein [Alcaligenes sp.]
VWGAGVMGWDLKLDNKHDLAVGPDQDLMLVGGAQRIRQQITVTLLTFLGEWFLDQSWGMPYFEKIMVKAPSRVEIENLVRAKVRDVPGVKAVPAVDIQIDALARRARITLPDIETDEGPLTVSVIQ